MLDRDVIADVETLVEARMRAHQQPDGSYSCDPHVMVGYVLQALAEAQARDDLKVDRAVHALSRFVFPGMLVPRMEMARAVIDAVLYPDGYAERLPTRTIVRIPTESAPERSTPPA